MMCLNNNDRIQHTIGLQALSQAIKNLLQQLLCHKHTLLNYEWASKELLGFKSTLLLS
jgi:hypothetical protein